MPWRVEFRTMEMQPTIEDNIKFCTFIELLSKIICDKDMKTNFYMPISLVDENQETGYLAGAATEQKFWFRKEITGSGKDEYIKLTLAEILNGKPGEFAGLRKLFNDYICK
jgi:glutamate--cysteine ligase catalytic subunit